MEAYLGERNEKFFGIVSIPKVFHPILMLILIQISIPGASFLGHLFGILAALLLRVGLGRLLLPEQGAVEWFESKVGDITSITYYKA